MGQPITVLETTSSTSPAVLRFETNRPLSGMGHERYERPPSELLQRPVDELARRLFAAGGVEKIHINGSVVTVTVGGGRTGEGLGDIIRHLFLHYGDAPSGPMEAPPSEADRTPEMLADTADAPSAREHADDAPAPVDPDAAPAGDQSIEGIPEAELADSADADPTEVAPDER